MNCIKEEKNTRFKAGFRAVRNMFLVYLFVSAITDRYKIFAAICASFPFIIPVIFCSVQMPAWERIIRSLCYGVAGIIVSVIFMTVMKAYTTAAWIVPAAYGLLMCIGFSLVQEKLTEHKRTVMRCIISLAVCFLAFV